MAVMNRIEFSWRLYLPSKEPLPAGQLPKYTQISHGETEGGPEGMLHISRREPSAAIGHPIKRGEVIFGGVDFATLQAAISEASGKPAPPAPALAGSSTAVTNIIKGLAHWVRAAKPPQPPLEAPAGEPAAIADDLIGRMSRLHASIDLTTRQYQDHSSNGTYHHELRTVTHSDIEGGT